MPPGPSTPFPFPRKTLPFPNPLLVLKPASGAYTHFEHGDALAFNAQAREFSRLNAWWLADAALLAYWPEDEVDRRCKAASFTTVKPFDRHGTQGFIASKHDVMI